MPKPKSSPAKKSIYLYSNTVIELLKSNIKNNTVLIFENSFYHQECTPGYTKYFLDLGFNVDIIIDSSGLNTFCLFKSFENIRAFTFYNSSQFSEHSKEFQLVFNNYRYILVETTEHTKKKTYEDLGLFKMNNTIFVFHHFEFIKPTGIESYYNQNRIWSLGNLKNTLYVNPHYFGDIKIRNKNNITKFFITSNFYKNYNDLVLAAEKLNNENLDFEVMVIGKRETFSNKNITESLKTILNLNIMYHLESYMKLLIALII